MKNQVCPQIWFRVQAARDQPLNHMNYDGVTHEFFGVGAAVDEASGAQQFAAAELKKAFSQWARGGRESPHS